jgi:ubiquinone/menaquinone biosynthesis C-methylase UbiE
MLFILLPLRQTGLRLVKRRQALVETNLSRNSQLETHRSDELGSRPKPAPRFPSGAGRAVSKIDRFPHAWENSSLALSCHPSMSDIDLYTESPELYDQLQQRRPDYVEAIEVSSMLAARHTAGSNVRLLDLCCGTAATTLRFSQLHPAAKVELVDMNSEFLTMAESSGIVAQELVVVDKDVREYEPRRDFNLVFSIFAYHHVPDEDKGFYIDTIASALNQNGLLLLAEIFFQDKTSERAYYHDLLEAIPGDKRSDQLKSFLEQTANSADFEFKVSKTYADRQFLQRGFHLVEETKIWPKKPGDDGTYVQLYRYGAEKNEL